MTLWRRAERGGDDGVGGPVAERAAAQGEEELTDLDAGIEGDQRRLQGHTHGKSSAVLSSKQS